MSNLLKDELFNGTKEGLYIVKEPIIGYKVVISYLNNGNNIITYLAILKLEIPKGAIIVRPIDTNDTNQILPSKELRTDKVIFKEVEQIHNRNFVKGEQYYYQKIFDNMKKYDWKYYSYYLSI